MSKMHLYLERFWMVVAIILTIVTTIYMIQDGWSSSRLFWLLTGIAWAMFFMRRGVRRRLEKHAANPPKKKK
jgi:hypothetical protein